jgi:surfeit locus 1 family protein
MSLRQTLPVLLAAGLGLAILLSLGIWQVQRLHWKEALLSELDARGTMAALPLPGALKLAEAGEDIEYRRIHLDGEFDHAREMLKVTNLSGGAAWEVITPLRDQSGFFVLVDRGAVPDTLKAQDSRKAASRAAFDGIIRFHASGRGVFDPENDPTGNIWHWWDVPAMQAAAQIPPDATIAPFIVQRLPAGAEESPPFAAQPRAILTNNHLGYAITWFGLALALAGVTGAFLWRRSASST